MNNATRTIVFCLSLVFGSAPIGLQAASPGEHVAIVVNSDSWASRYIANEYARWRAIPSNNLVLINGLSNWEQISVDEFRRAVLLPSLKKLEQRGLADQIDYVLYSADIPTAIDVRGDVKDQKLPKVFTPVASVNGLTYLYQFTLQKDIRYLALEANAYARKQVMKSKDSSWDFDEQKSYMESIQAFAVKQEAIKGKTLATDAEKKEWQETLATLLASLKRFQEKHPKSADVHYNIACVLAIMNRPDEALIALSESVQYGFFDHRKAASDEDLKSLHGRPEFEKIVGLMKKVPFEIEPSVSFRGRSVWRAPADAEAPRYLLSTVLACTNGRGLTVRESLEQLKRSVEADGTHPTGTVYFERNGDVRSTTREWGFLDAAQKLRERGVRAIVEEGVLPQKRTDVAGTMVGIAGFDWGKSGSKMVPGAIAEHLTSLGGVMVTNGGQTPLSEFLRNGAAGASGAVTEPYALQQKFPTPFIHVHYADGCTLAEAFYQSLAGPYQLLIVGDALCQPWKRPIQVEVTGLPEDRQVKGTLTLNVHVELAGTADSFSLALYVDGIRVRETDRGNQMMLDTRQLGDGHHTMAIVAQSKSPVSQMARWNSPIVVRNISESDQLTATKVPDADVEWSKPISIPVAAAKATWIALLCNGEPLRRLEGDRGSFNLVPSELGPGPIELQPIASFDDAPATFAGPAVLRYTRGKPIQLHIQLPAPVDVSKVTPPKNLSDGWLVKVADRKEKIVPKVDDSVFRGTSPSGGTELKLGPNEKAVLRGWFEAAQHDLYHLQCRGNVKIRSVTIDGRTLPVPISEGLSAVPINASRGWHQVQIEVEGVRDSSLDLRFAPDALSPTMRAG